MDGIGAHDNTSTLSHGLLFWRAVSVYADPLNPVLATSDPPGWSLGRRSRERSLAPPQLDDNNASGGDGGWPPSKVLDLTVPSDANFQGCNGSSNANRPFAIWTEGNGSWRCMQGPGQTDRVYVLDVDGQRVVITLVGFPDLGGAYLRDVQAMLDSLEFETP
jgi:hypothetical protein